MRTVNQTVPKRFLTCSISVPTLIGLIESAFAAKVRPQVASLASLVEAAGAGGPYHKYHGMFTHVMQRLVFSAALAHYFRGETLLAFADAAGPDWLDVKTDPGLGFHLEVEDFLGGLILVSNELVSFIF